ncbi:hypothetical protein [Frigoriflavimonas asaccharolytica]|uniref:Cell division protein FtsW (Lipid II flippase) n=1 Tax=Frigoriflavimonas asaccharolytica TaxID=2735899 RepID=A0A8J8K7M3_9FLAO|nr:hypothetical protein [Frigoriflavimonas asaccharolytica]NRS91097.1 cell division protein FtsW (lipid II flippase) [Frigoriflavimonas asaccharolytica]
MKNLNYLQSSLSKMKLMAIMVLASVYSFAQDSTSKVVNTTTTTTKTEEFYTNPIYWVIGGLVLIIIIALFARGNGKKD